RAVHGRSRACPRSRGRGAAVDALRGAGRDVVLVLAGKSRAAPTTGRRPVAIVSASRRALAGSAAGCLACAWAHASLARARRLQSMDGGMRQGTIAWAALGLMWLVATASGMSLVWDYEYSPGDPAVAPARWPEASLLERTPGRATLVMMAHPHCPCTRAS